MTEPWYPIFSRGRGSGGRSEVAIGGRSPGKGAQFVNDAASADTGDQS